MYNTFAYFMVVENQLDGMFEMLAIKKVNGQTVSDWEDSRKEEISNLLNDEQVS